jgi:hypothetical protein
MQTGTNLDFSYPPAQAARTRRILLALYLLVAFGDVASKALATNKTINRVLTRHVSGRLAVRIDSAQHPAGNFEIFRAASRHLIIGKNLYASYPGELQDRFKYSPTFAFIFTPLALLPWPVALFLWHAVNALLLFVGLEKLLPTRAAHVAIACLLPEVLRSMQNAQSNALVAALIIFAFLALERERAWRAAAVAVLGAFVKIFPLAAFAFAIPRRQTKPIGIAGVLISLLLITAPLMVTTPAVLRAQYRWWGETELIDSHQRWFSVMELAHRWLGVDWPNWPMQLVGAFVLLAPILLRRERWTDERFRLGLLCSVLLYVALFNHQAERSSYLIGFVGATIWFVIGPASGTQTSVRRALYGVAMLTIPLMSTLVPIPDALRSPTAMLYRLTLPTLAIWIMLQRDLLRVSSVRHVPFSRARRNGSTEGPDAVVDRAPLAM